MVKLDELVKGVIENGIAEKTENADEILQLTEVIQSEEEKITGEYSKIGELYCKLNPDASMGELGKLVMGVKASEKKIKDSKLKIGELLGFTFCEACGGEVDDDALFCNNCGHKMPVKLLPGMVLCKHCNKAVREGIRFCTNCGKSMFEEPEPEIENDEPAEEKKALKECPNCGFTTDDPEKMFCDDCGRRLVGESGEPVEAEQEEPKVPTHKICPNCGFKVFDAETMFCDDCGRRLVEDENA